MAGSDTHTRFEEVRANGCVNGSDAESIITQLKSVIKAIESGHVTAIAFIVKEDGYSRWTSFRSAMRSDTYNLIGQLHALMTQIASELND